MVDIPVLIDLITRGGLVSALIIALVGGMRGWYVWKHVHEEALRAAEERYDDAIKGKDEQLLECRQDKEYWKNQAIKLLSTTERVVTAVESSRKAE